MDILIKDYLQVLPNYTFPDRIVARALGEYKIDPDTPAYDVPERERDLMEAVMWDAAAGIVNGGASRKKIGDRSITTANLQTSQQDRAAWTAKANSLREKWGITPPSSSDVFQIVDLSGLW